MADVKISDLPAATTPLDGTESIPVVQSGLTKKSLLSDMPVSAPQQSAIDGKASLSGATFSGPVVVPAGATGAQVPQAQETLLKAGSLSGLASAATARTNLGLGSAAVAPILGTVSQSGGVPTGAIVETGSGANGIYVRYADGTQICWHNAAVTCAASTATSVSWTYPAVFASATQANVKFMGANVGDIRGGAEGVSTSSASGFLINSAASSRAGTAQWFAIGRWF